jgi:uncharacterized delta-60 repeat protein
LRKERRFMRIDRFAGFVNVSRGSMIESLECRQLLSAGQLDPTFSGDGRFSAAIPGNITVTDGTAQSDGKILVAGTIDGSSGKDLFVARVTADGALDTSFSGDGIATVSIGTADALDANVVVDSSGNIVVAGGTENSFSVVRFLSDGNLDSSFSGDGITTLSTPGYSSDDVAIQSDGKILGLADGKLFRLTAAGALDTTYGDQGFAKEPGEISGGMRAVSVGPNDKAVIAGTVFGGARSSWDAVARFNSDGTVDTSFTYDPSMGDNATGGPGFALTSIYDDNGLSDVTVGPDGSIYTAGFTSTEPSLFTVEKFAPDGKFQWEDDGYSDSYRNSSGEKIALQTDGKVVVGVQAFPVVNPADSGDFVLIRYDTDGKRDTSFGQDGTVRTDFTDFRTIDLFGNPSDDALVGLALVNGQYVAIGGTGSLVFERPTGTIEIARYDGGNTPYVSPVTTLGDGSIQAVGTNGDDQIAYYGYWGWRASSNAVNVNGAVFIVPETATSYRINSFDGNDVIVADFSFDATGTAAQIDAGADDDIVYSFADTSTIYGGDGNDYLSDQFGVFPTNASATVYGGIGQDTLFGGDGADLLFGEGGNDYLYGNGGDDHLEGGGGNDSVYGMGGNDYVIGSSGNDRVEGGAGDDRMEGQSGNDSLYGNSGRDGLFGGSGDDLLDGGTGADYMQGDDGHDTLTYASRGNPVTVTLGNTANDGEAGEGDNARSDIEDLIGGGGNDSLTGSSLVNRIYGLAGNDVIHLGSGNDYAEGGAGNDTIYGDAGRDQLYGNGGNDTFFAKDNEVDSLDGGSGTDSAQRDNSASVKDSVLNIETFIA